MANYEKVNIWRETNRLTLVCRYVFVGVISGTNLFPVFRQKMGRVERDFSEFVVLNCLQLKIIFMSKSNFLGDIFWIPSVPFKFCTHIL